jgi:hypothetical protein
MELTEKGNSYLMLQMENGNSKLQFICCIQKQKTKVCFPWLANNKSLSTIAVSATCQSMMNHIKHEHEL